MLTSAPIHDATTPIDDLELTPGELDGRRVWFVSNGTTIPWVGGGDGSDDGDDGADGSDDGGDGGDDGADGSGGDDGSGDGGDGGEGDVAAIQALAKELGITPGQLKGRIEASRKWENRAKKSQSELEKLRRAGMSPDEKALDDAKAEGARTEREKVGQKLVAAEIRAQGAGIITREQYDLLVDGLNLDKFLDDDGDVDTAKVEALIKGIAKPDTGEDDKKKRRLDSGQGRRQGADRSGSRSGSVADGRDLFAERHGKKTTSTT
jgi:transposase-like protein